MSLPRHSCTACDGGHTSDWDYDLEHEVTVRCEGCAGCGYVGTCADCYECAPASELDASGGRCAMCFSLGAEADVSAERFELLTGGI